MSQILNIPAADGYESQLDATLASTATTGDKIKVKELTAATVDASNPTSIVVSPGTPAAELISVNAKDTLTNEYTILARALPLYRGHAPSPATHARNTTVAISDNHDFWDSMADAVNSKLDTAGGTVTGTLGFTEDDETALLRLPNMTTAVRDTIASPVNGLKIYNTTTGTEQVYDGGAWSDIATSPAAQNGSETVNGIWQGATTAEMTAATETGTTGGKLVVMNKNLTGTSAGAGDAGKVPVLDSNGLLDSSLGVGVAGLTATASELNQVCDGTTATAANLNTLTDGSDASTLHTHSAYSAVGTSSRSVVHPYLFETTSGGSNVASYIGDEGGSCTGSSGTATIYGLFIEGIAPSGNNMKYRARVKSDATVTGTERTGFGFVQSATNPSPGANVQHAMFFIVNDVIYASVGNNSAGTSSSAIGGYTSTNWNEYRIESDGTNFLFYINDNLVYTSSGNEPTVLDRISHLKYCSSGTLKRGYFTDIAYEYDK